jgi:hypothetical protein
MALSGGTKAATESQLVRENIETLVTIAPKTRVAFPFELDESLAVFMEGEVNRVEDSKYFVEFVDGTQSEYDKKDILEGVNSYINRALIPV